MPSLRRVACGSLCGAVVRRARLLSAATWEAASPSVHLVARLAARQISQRTRGTWLGSLWLLARPALSLTVYGFVFGSVFKVRWGHAAPDSGPNFALGLFAGLIVFNFVSDTVGAAPFMVIHNQAYVRRTLFPSHLLAWVQLAVALHSTLLQTFVFIAFGIVTGHLAWTFLFWPIALAPLLLGCLGISWVIGAIGVYFRDIGEIVSLCLMLLMFLTPIFYPLEAVPEPYRTYVAWNPLAMVVDHARLLAFSAQVPPVTQVAGLYAGGLACAGLGLWLFRTLARGFTDVL
jgi:lipopolysaccharide transport system permease protein